MDVIVAPGLSAFPVDAWHMAMAWAICTAGKTPLVLLSNGKLRGISGGITKLQGWDISNTSSSAKILARNLFRYYLLL